MLDADRPSPRVFASSDRIRLLVVAGVVVALFALSVPLRAPWRGSLSKGDGWASGQTLRFLRTWQRDGAFASRFALVLTPPTAEFQGQRVARKWGTFGHHLLLYVLTRPFGLDVDVELLHRINLGIHLLFSLLMALLAYVLARGEWHFQPWLAAAAAAHCGAFCLYLPVLLHWGQHFSGQTFTILPLFAFCAWGRWLRARLAPGRARRLVEWGVVACVFYGVLCDFFFWLLPLYWVGERRLARWRRREQQDDGWARLVFRPFLVGMALLLVVFSVNGQLFDMLGRGLKWAGPGTNPQQLLLSIPVRVAGFIGFVGTHFWNAYGVIGVLTPVLVLAPTLRRRPLPGVSPQGRRLLLDLLVPCLLFVFILAPHQFAHSFSAMKFTPFVALTWTLLVPAVVATLPRSRARLLGAAYGTLAGLTLLPLTNHYREYMPVPEPGWQREATFLRAHTRPDDIIFSPSTEIHILPPQRIALAERLVRHAYTPLDIHFLLQTARWDRPRFPIAIYRSHEGPDDLAALGGQTTREDGYSVTRLSQRRLRRILGSQVYGPYLDMVDEVLAGDFPPGPGSRQLQPRRLRALEPGSPLALHIQIVPAHRRRGKSGYESIYWWDDRHFHHARADAETLVLGDLALSRPVYQGEGLPFAPAEEVDGAASEWVAFVARLFREVAEQRPPRAYRWKGHQVVPLPAGPVPAPLRERAPEVGRWEAHLFYRAGMLRSLRPVALVLVPGSRSRTEGPEPRVSILLDPLSGELSLPGYLSPGLWVLRNQEAAYRLPE